MSKKTLELFNEPYIVTAIVGKRRSGKTYLCKKILTETDMMTRSKTFIIICPTHYQDSVMELKKFALDRNIDVQVYHTFPMDRLPFPEYSTIFIDDTGLILKKNFDHMVYISAHKPCHWNIFILSQRFNVLGRIRSNVQYFFIFRYTNNIETKLIWEEIVSGNTDYSLKEFQKICSELERYQCMMIYDDGENVITKIVKAK